MKNTKSKSSAVKPEPKPVKGIRTNRISLRLNEEEIADFGDTGAEDGMVRLFINIGKKQNVRPSDILGAIAGAAVLMLLVGKDSGLGANALYNGSIWLSLLVEVILTFVFVLAILGVTSKTENTAVSGIVIGLTLTLVHILGISFTGTSVNPARSLGPALLVGGEALSCVWVFLVAPLVGGVLAALVYKFLTTEKK